MCEEEQEKIEKEMDEASKKMMKQGKHLYYNNGDENKKGEPKDLKVTRVFFYVSVVLLYIIIIWLASR